MTRPPPPLPARARPAAASRRSPCCACPCGPPPCWPRGLQPFFGRPVTVGSVRVPAVPAGDRGPRPAGGGGARRRRPRSWRCRVLVAVPAPAPAVGPPHGAGQPVASAARVVRVQRLARRAATTSRSSRPETAGRAGVRIGRLLIDGQRGRGQPRARAARPRAARLQRAAGRRRAAPCAGACPSGPGAVRFGENPPLPFSLHADLALRGRAARGGDGARGGRAHQPHLPRPAGPGARCAASSTCTGPVDLGVLEQYVVRTGLRPAGAARVTTGWRPGDGSRLRLAGPRRRRATGSFDGIAVPRYGGPRGLGPRRRARARPGAGRAGRQRASWTWTCRPRRGRVAPRRRSCAAWTPSRSRAGSSTSARPAWAPPPRGPVALSLAARRRRARSPAAFAARPRRAARTRRTPLARARRVARRGRHAVRRLGGPAHAAHAGARCPAASSATSAPTSTSTRRAATSRAADDLLVRLRRALGTRRRAAGGGWPARAGSTGRWARHAVRARVRGPLRGRRRSATWA